MHQNSLTAFESLKASGAISRQESQVIEAIINYPGYTRKTLAKYVLQMDYSTVCARVSGLKDRGILYEKGEKNHCACLYFEDREEWHKRKPAKKSKFEQFKEDSQAMCEKYGAVETMSGSGVCPTKNGHSGWVTVTIQKSFQL